MDEGHNGSQKSEVRNRNEKWKMGNAERKEKLKDDR